MTSFAGQHSESDSCLPGLSVHWMSYHHATRGNVTREFKFHLNTRDVIISSSSSLLTVAGGQSYKRNLVLNFSIPLIKAFVATFVANLYGMIPSAELKYTNILL
jgi:hypothetical protein